MDFKLRTNAKYFSSEDVLADLRDAAKKLGKNTVSSHEYPKHGKFSVKVFRNRFGDWNKALQAAGLMVTFERNLSTDALFENLEKVWLSLSRQPFYGEMRGCMTAAARSMEGSPYASRTFGCAP